jgi:hypothetical protein
LEAFPLASIQNDEQMDAACWTEEQMLMEPEASLDEGEAMYLGALRDLIEAYHSRLDESEE